MWSTFETLPADSLCCDCVLIFFRKSHSISSVALNMKSRNKKSLWKFNIFDVFFMNPFLQKELSLLFHIEYHHSIPGEQRNLTQVEFNEIWLSGVGIAGRSMTKWECTGQEMDWSVSGRRGPREDSLPSPHSPPQLDWAHSQTRRLSSFRN